MTGSRSAPAALLLALAIAGCSVEPDVCELVLVEDGLLIRPVGPSATEVSSVDGTLCQAAHCEDVSRELRREDAPEGVTLPPVLDYSVDFDFSSTTPISYDLRFRDSNQRLIGSSSGEAHVTASERCGLPATYFSLIEADLSVTGLPSA